MAPPVTRRSTRSQSTKSLPMTYIPFLNRSSVSSSEDEEDDTNNSKESDQEGKGLPPPGEYTKIIKELTNRCSDVIVENIAEKMLHGQYEGIINPKYLLKAYLDRSDSKNLVVKEAWNIA